MKVTYIIAHHNYQNFLRPCLQSALWQTYPKESLGICVIDDFSENQEYTKQIVNEQLFFGGPDEVIYKDNLEIHTKRRGPCCRDVAIYITDRAHGPSYARNIGFKETWDDTDIFAVLDADDENYPTKIEKCVAEFKKHPNQVGVVYGDYNTLNTTTGNMVREYKESFDLNRLRQECIVHSGSLISKEALEATKEETGYYDETMRTCEDYDLWMRIAEKYMICHIAEALSLVRIQPQNSTATVKNEIWQRNWQRIRSKFMKRHDIKN